MYNKTCALCGKKYVTSLERNCFCCKWCCNTLYNKLPDDLKWEILLEDVLTDWK